MALKDRIDRIKGYFVNLNVDTEEEATLVLARFPVDWRIPNQSELAKTYGIQIAPAPEGVYFATEISNGEDVIFDAIEFVIDFNKEAEERTQLLNKKIEELTEVFTKEPLERLRELSFTMPEIEEEDTSEEEEKKDTVKVEVPKENKKVEKKYALKEEKAVPEKKKNKDHGIAEDSSLMDFAQGLVKE